MSSRTAAARKRPAVREDITVGVGWLMSQLYRADIGGLQEPSFGRKPARKIEKNRGAI
jgi:hypothetical protein